MKVGITVISFIITEGFFIWIFQSNDIHLHEHLRIVSEHCLSLDSMIHCICLSLQYTFMDKYYYKICNKCHESCWKCCHQNRRQSIHIFNTNSNNNNNNNIAIVKTTTPSELPDINSIAIDINPQNEKTKRMTKENEI